MLFTLIIICDRPQIKLLNQINNIIKEGEKIGRFKLILSCDKNLAKKSMLNELTLTNLPIKIINLVKGYSLRETLARINNEVEGEFVIIISSSCCNYEGWLTNIVNSFNNSLTNVMVIKHEENLPSKSLIFPSILLKIKQLIDEYKQSQNIFICWYQNFFVNSYNIAIKIEFLKKINGLLPDKIDFKDRFLYNRIMREIESEIEFKILT